ncbi:tol-pal system protein YbgF [Ningiella sp. W23]|uniref:tol-pal system protein YbgF n=1 Tax=Ningiella sp. W23 TaxID=3023715 RepID=UPI003756C80F
MNRLMLRDSESNSKVKSASFKLVTGVIACCSLTGYSFAQAPVIDVNTSSQSVLQSAGTPSSGDLEARLAVIERIVESRSNTQQRMQQQLDMLQSDVDSIRGSIELHNHQLEKILERQRELFLELDRRFENLQVQSAGVGSNIASAGGTPSAQSGSTSNTPTVSVPVTMGEQDAYQNAVNLILQEQDYERAVPAFENFLSQYPNSDLTDNAHYWLGQLLYNSQDWDGAKEQFAQVADKFANSPKRADSLLKLGMIAKTQGDANLARQYFEKVIAEYPNTTPARLSNEQLAQG